MNTNQSHSTLSRGSLSYCFPAFAALIALRDITYDLWLRAHISPVLFALIICATIAFLSSSRIAWSGAHRTLWARIKRPAVLARIAILGVLAAAVYLITFLMIDRVGAGIFNLVDYGLAPLLTALFGVCFFRERVEAFWLPCALAYSLGVLFLFGASATSLALFLAASVSPLASAGSDAIAKSLLDPARVNLDRNELLAVRFIPATLAIAFASPCMPGAIHFDWSSLPAILLAAATLGYFPLFLLVTGLRTGKLSTLSVSEFAIPVLAYFGTLHNHMETMTPRSVSGALMIIAAISLPMAWSSFLARRVTRKPSQ